MRSQDELEKELEALFLKENPDVHYTGLGVVDKNTTKAVALLGLTMIHLDRTSKSLARVNLLLTAVVVVATLLQLWLAYGSGK